MNKYQVVNFMIWGVHSSTVDLDLSENSLEAEAFPTKKNPEAQAHTPVCMLRGSVIVWDPPRCPSVQTPTLGLV